MSMENYFFGSDLDDSDQEVKAIKPPEKIRAGCSNEREGVARDRSLILCEDFTGKRHDTHVRSLPFQFYSIFQV